MRSMFQKCKTPCGAHSAHKNMPNIRAVCTLYEPVTSADARPIISVSAKFHLPDSQARCSRGRRPSFAESVLSSTYWGREDDLDIEYSLIFQLNAN